MAMGIDSVMEVNPTSHTPAHNVTAAAAPFQA